MEIYLTMLNILTLQHITVENKRKLIWELIEKYKLIVAPNKFDMGKN